MALPAVGTLSRSRLSIPIALIGAIAFLFVATPAMPQATKGTLLGTVSDIQGALVPGANVIAVETETSIQRTVVTNTSGQYVFVNLKDGTYKVEAELSGFKRVSRPGVVVKVNSTVRIDLTLEPGGITETMEVKADTPVLQTDRADTGRTIEGAQVAAMPLGYNRNFQGMWVTVPGSVTLSAPHSVFFNSQRSLETKFNGQSRMSNNVQVDGLDNNQKTGLLQVMIPNAESIDSVNVATSNFDAEFGRAGGSVTTVVLKSGTNTLRGSAFFFGNNEDTQARNSFSKPDSIKAPTKYQQWGATLGGPVIKNKLFVFADFQRTVDNLGSTRRAVVPPAEWRKGNFSSAPTTIYDPATGNADGTGRTPFPGNIIPPSRLSPVAQSILNLLPAPNIAGVALGQNNYEYNGTRESTTNSTNVKLNYNPTANDQLSARFSYQNPVVFDPGTYGVYGGPHGGGFSGEGNMHTYSGALTWTRALAQGLMLDVRAGISKYDNKAATQGAGLNTSTEVGIPGANYSDFTTGLSKITINQGYSNPAMGFSHNLPWDRGEKTYSTVAMITKVTGQHVIKVGTEIRHNEDYLLQNYSAGGVRGEFIFNANQTALPTDTKSTNGQANSFASFLLDVPGTVQRDVIVMDRPGTKHWGVFAFAQDKWQVSRKLTVDIGVRWEYYTPLRGIVDQGGLSNYDGSNNTLRVAGYGEIPQNVGVKSTWTNFAPRLGAAYRINEKTVMRAGFGTSIMPFPDNLYAYNFPVKQSNQAFAANQYASPGKMANGFGAPVFFPIPDNGIVDASVPSLKNASVTMVPTDLHEAKIHSWNIAVQRQLVGKVSLELAYVGNVAKDVTNTYNANAGMVLGADNAGRLYNTKYGRTSDVMSWFRGDTKYNSLQVKLDSRFWNGFTMNTSYTLGRAENYGDDNYGTNTPADFEKSYGRAGFDRTHVFASSMIYDMPFFKESNGIAHWVLGGWQISGIFTAYSGTPVDFTSSGNTLKAPGNTQRPNKTADPEILGGIGPGQKYFDTSVFSAPAQNTWGNMTRNDSISGPGFWNIDASLVKRLTFGRMGLELRADAFNLTNSPHFGNPNGGFGSTTFGEINSSWGERLVRFGARLQF